MGTICTRNCGFCAVEHGRPAPLDAAEPARVARAACELGLEYIVVTSVTRDDLPDGGAHHFAVTARVIKAIRPSARVELLIPDLAGDERAQRVVAEAPVDVLGHNIETVPALYGRIRREADYDRSLRLIRHMKVVRGDVPVKSGLMLGLGERSEELKKTLRDMLEAGVDMLTLGQYLRPSKRQVPVRDYVDPDGFAAWRARALEMGFACVEAGPFVRSSFNAFGTWSDWRWRRS